MMQQVATATRLYKVKLCVAVLLSVDKALFKHSDHLEVHLHLGHFMHSYSPKIP
jgi:hypothetical protein